MESLKVAGISVAGQVLGQVQIRACGQLCTGQNLPQNSKPEPRNGGIVHDLALVNVPLYHKFAPPPLPAESADEAAGLLGECPPANC